MTTSAAGGLRCAEAARQRGDPPLGTAPMVRRWLLIEHPGPWPVEALDVPDFSPALRSTLAGAARAVVGRVLLVRRPGRTGQDRSATSRAWAVVVDGGVHWGRWRAPEDLRNAASALRHPPTDLDHDLVLLVCAHGVHDTCCALRGRPVAAALAEAWPAATWECTHVGGDRFAPNVVVLPDGIYYGYLDPDEVGTVIRRHVAGELSAAFLRGLTRYPPPVQVAVGTAHRWWGPFGVDDVGLRGAVQSAPDRWDVDLAVPGRGQRRLSVVATPQSPARLTCRAAQETSAVAYDVRAPGP